MTEERNMNAMTHMLRERADRARQTLADHAKAVTDNPQHAMRWADSAFAAAADLEVAERCLRIVDHLSRGGDGADVASVRQAVERLMLDQVTTEYGTSSSSPSANLASRQTTRAWVDVSRDLVFYG